MAEIDVKKEIKEIIKKNPVITQIEIINKLISNKITSKKTAQKYLKNLELEREILVKKNGKNHHHFLHADDLQYKTLTKNFNIRIDDLKKTLDQIQEKFPGHSHNTQKFLYNSTLERFQFDVQRMENIIKDNEQYENEPWEKQTFSENKEKIMDLITELTTTHKLTDYDDDIDYLHKLLNLMPKKINKISELKKQKQSRITPIERKKITNEIEKRKTELERIFLEMEDLITSMNHLKESEALPVELDFMGGEFRAIQFNINRLEMTVPILQNCVKRFRIKENLKSEGELFNETDSDVMELSTSLKRIYKNIKKIRDDRNSNELVKDMHESVLKLENAIKNTKFD